MAANKTTTVTVSLTVEQAGRIAELLEITDQFLRTDPHDRLHGLEQILHERGISGGVGWLTDQIGLTALSLRTAAGDAATTGGAR